MMQGWGLVPGIALILAGYAIQFGSFVIRPRPLGWIMNAVRIRFIGFGALFLEVGLDFVISALRSGLPVGSLVLGIVMIAMAGTWFYAASDRILRGPPVS